eukprot:TRINITY_DN2294_c0_g1_i1.p1 TRINITY_DN2294_c0_g1~~TRINITY_DN2294_c0_g1_i1.p1  ORF type:complete len:389 (-),score=47.76 TRINITY_DN2294_c0_g1_i1:61-1227(-)
MDNEREGFPITAIREIKILRQLKHENIITLKDIITSSENAKGKGSIYMVFEYMDHDLNGLMDSRQYQGSWWTLSEIKCYMKQLLEALYYCHKNNVLHRDVKGSNLLINNDGELKLADFGLARPYSETSSQYTNRVITLWYRPPELLLGSTFYGPAIDMWSVGCILAELLTKKPIFPGRSEVDQLDLIFKYCGAPTPENWPGADSLPWFKMFRPKHPYKRRIRDFFREFPKEIQDLVDDLLMLDPRRRISAEQALDHDFFFCDPLPCDKSSLPKYDSSHEWLIKKKRIQQQTEQAQDRAKRQRIENNGTVEVEGRSLTRSSSGVATSHPSAPPNVPTNNNPPHQLSRSGPPFSSTNSVSSQHGPTLNTIPQQSHDNARRRGPGLSLNEG